MRRPVFVASARALLITAGALLMPLAAFASPTDYYLSARAGSPPPPGLTLEMVAQNPDGSRGMTVEVTGRLLGTARTDDGASLMLSTDRHGVVNLQIGDLPDWVQPGDRLRVLAVIGGGKTEGTTIGMPDLLAVALASASDVEAAELRWQREQQARLARRNTPRASWPARTPAWRGPSAPSPRPSLDARTAQLSRSLSANAKAVYEPYRAAIRSYNRRLSEREVDTITTSVLSFSEQMDVDPRLIIALIIAESSFNPGASSRVGAMGLGQIMPGTAREIGLNNPYDPVQNIAGAVYLLKTRLDKYSGGANKSDLQMRHIHLALAAYNAGMGAVKKYGGIPPYRETRNYVKKVEQIYRRLCGGGGR